MYDKLYIDNFTENVFKKMCKPGIWEAESCCETTRERQPYTANGFITL